MGSVGPAPHIEAIGGDNPLETDGFEFVEFAHPEPEKLGALLSLMGFAPVCVHRSKNVTLYRQGDINFVLNAEPDSFAAQFAEAHGPSVCAVGFRVRDAAAAYRSALKRGAKAGVTQVGPMELEIPAIAGVGGALIYLVDRYGDKGSIWEIDFRWSGERDPHPPGVGLTAIDHLTNNVHRGHLDSVASWYERIFNFHQIRYFDITGKFTGLHSRAMTSPCGKIRIPVNESADESSQIEEFLRDYRGEGVQHVACSCHDIFETVAGLRAAGLKFIPEPPQSYYDSLERRLPGHGQSVKRLRELGILIDGEGAHAGQPPRLLLQIFTQALLGPIFFEFIERKGDDGFGEGNFRALFEAMEEDQLRRGVLQQASE
ncbi:4-hydroxyphenylpyruvate dioxygenase [Methylocystis bryophila]|uniref:4-hydroxyphenylpyruvate dioxygenase n=1 Tax=Methylocystis bryophila TaxID=655015 RepID=A0A1W6MXR9_9HYPH|nr:4-hydroxyphenylpyruvate dioxygenase [Methylocystis bryophila]ARN82395.1 4-hydroxyphenylpyruvate dioxygenase [Methylocystis bryophila]BDV38567.1 4-hydroxyphenylpyruvate dioxygenase [Methylocystis bryophila]